MYHLDKKIDEYSEELFVDLGLVTLPEERKADIYARLQENLHRVIIKTLGPSLGEAELSKIHEALEQEDYRGLGKILKRYPQYQNALEEKIEQEYQNLKLTIGEELKNAQNSSRETAGGEAASGESTIS